MTDEASITFQPWEERVTASDDRSLLEAAADAGIDIESLCGGEGLCGTCKVVVEEGTNCLSEPTPADDLLLSESELERGYRLSCRASIEAPCTDDHSGNAESAGGTGSSGDEANTEDTVRSAATATPGEVVVTVPRVSQNTGGIVLTEGAELEVDLDPAVRQYHVELDEPTLEDTVADRERLLEGLADGYDVHPEAVDYRLLRTLPKRLREREVDGRLDVTATVYDEREVVDLTPGVHEEHYGLAVDVGTTTLAVYLLDLRTGDVEAVSSRLNPQSAFGGDIMTRVRHTRNQDDGLAELREAVVEGVNECVADVTTEAGVDPEHVYEGVFVGNTAMHHLFLGIDPSYVAGSPYVGANHAPLELKAREVGLDINPGGYCYWLPISGGWVGPDKVSVLLVSGHYRDDELTVCIDIGTNGEISVGNRDALWTTSAPAGPALEGAEITHGVRAQEGAIEHVTVDADTFEPEVETIGDTPPSGICGSGVIDAVAELFEAGVLDRRGKFREEALRHDRVRRNDDDVVEYVLVWSEHADVDGDVVLTQNDIREIQMAKAAIQAGTLVLMDELDVDEVDRVVLAGGFGNYIDPDSARTIGLYPDTPFENVETLGNAAGIGAQLALLDREARREATHVVERATYYEIAGTDVFRDCFLESMYLPHQDFDRYPRVRDRLEAIRDLDDVPQT